MVRPFQTLIGFVFGSKFYNSHSKISFLNALQWNYASSNKFDRHQSKKYKKFINFLRILSSHLCKAVKSNFCSDSNFWDIILIYLKLLISDSLFDAFYPQFYCIKCFKVDSDIFKLSFRVLILSKFFIILIQKIKFLSFFF